MALQTQQAVLLVFLQLNPKTGWILELISITLFKMCFQLPAKQNKLISWYDSWNNFFQP